MKVMDRPIRGFLQIGVLNQFKIKVAYVFKIFRKANISYLLIHTYVYAYSENS